MKTLNHFLHFGFMGAGIGSLITTLMLLLMGADGASIKELGVWLATSFLIGIYTTLMYNDRLRLLAATAIHFVLTFATVVLSGVICDYGNGLLAILKNMLPTFLVIYVVVYLATYFASKAQEKEVNKALSGD